MYNKILKLLLLTMIAKLLKHLIHSSLIDNKLFFHLARVNCSNYGHLSKYFLKTFSENIEYIILSLPVILTINYLLSI